MRISTLILSFGLIIGLISLVLVLPDYIIQTPIHIFIIILIFVIIAKMIFD